jgi:hypothetical protein
MASCSSGSLPVSLWISIPSELSINIVGNPFTLCNSQIEADAAASIDTQTKRFDNRLISLSLNNSNDRLQLSLFGIVNRTTSGLLSAFAVANAVLKSYKKSGLLSSLVSFNIFDSWVEFDCKLLSCGKKSSIEIINNTAAAKKNRIFVTMKIFLIVLFLLC